MAKDDLHGNVPDSARAVLLLVDVLNDLDFPKNGYLLSQAPQLAESIRDLKQRCGSAGIPCVYANDNHGKWRSDAHEVLRHASREDAPGRSFVQALAPGPNDYIVLKPKHSAFHETPLHLILQHMGAETLIIAGVTANACVLLTVGDAYVHGYRIFVPQDCVVALTPESNDESLHLMEESFGADTRASRSLEIETLSGADRVRRTA